ncbi:MAG: HNH endonuclease signature motif containing protein, partial [Thermoguttaceae bacterium]
MEALNALGEFLQLKITIGRTPQCERSLNKMDANSLNALKAALARYGWSAEAVELGITNGFRCVYCGRDLLRSIEDYDVWQFDHITPVSKGGPDTAENKAVACKLCNFAKRDFDASKVAGPNASIDELQRIAAAHVEARRKEKRDKLREIKRLLKDANLIGDDRFVGEGE